jgi:hypothetical protein
MVDSYQRELRSKFQSVNYCIVDFCEAYIDKEGQKIIAQILQDFVQILQDFVQNYIHTGCIKCDDHTIDPEDKLCHDCFHKSSHGQCYCEEDIEICKVDGCGKEVRYQDSNGRFCSSNHVIRDE